MAAKQALAGVTGHRIGGGLTACTPASPGPARLRGRPRLHRASRRG